MSEHDWRPASEAPSGVWCIVRVRAQPDCPYGPDSGWKWYPHETTKQAVKFGGRWWQWDAKGQSLVHFFAIGGKLASAGHGLLTAADWEVFVPDDAIPIPAGILTEPRVQQGAPR